MSRAGAGLGDIVVGADGWAGLGGRRWRCALGRGGITTAKREGDGATPAGRWPLRRLLWRADRLARPATMLPCAPLWPDDGWCDDPADAANYNRPVRLPYAGSHEALWRSDGLYDVIGILGHNDDPPVPGLGSAIFLHVAEAGLPPTAGCVALPLADLLALLAAVRPGAAMRILP